MCIRDSIIPSPKHLFTNRLAPAVTELRMFMFTFFVSQLCVVYVCVCRNDRLCLRLLLGQRDVYKRQKLDLVSENKKLLKLISKPTFKDRIISVSYTHLDVYKRQALRCLRF